MLYHTYTVQRAKLGSWCSYSTPWALRSSGLIARNIHLLRHLEFSHPPNYP